MVPSERKPTALIVDDDVGFIFWLGDIFSKAGWNIVPALNCQQAVALAAMFDLYIDVVVVNPALTGVPEMIETLSRVHRPKVVIIRDPKVEAPIAADAILYRPYIESSASRAEWAERVRELLTELEPKPSSE